MVICDEGEPTCAICRDFFGGKFDTPKEIWESTSNYITKVEQTWKQCCEKGHIIPHALGGSDTDPENFVPICNLCNRLDPHTTDIEKWFQWVEIASHARESIDNLMNYVEWMKSSHMPT